MIILLERVSYSQLFCSVVRCVCSIHICVYTGWIFVLFLWFIPTITKKSECELFRLFLFRSS